MPMRSIREARGLLYDTFCELDDRENGMPLIYTFGTDYITPPTDKLWTRFVVVHTDDVRESIGNPVQRYREFGAAIAEIYTPNKKQVVVSQNDTDQLIQRIIDKFKGRMLIKHRDDGTKGIININRAVVNELGEVEFENILWSLIRISIFFDYETVTKDSGN